MWIWKDIEIDKELIGDTIIKGSGVFEKEYIYIKIPTGYGYDNYCFLLSSKCVHIATDKYHITYISICCDMNIELIYDNEKRENGKKYKRYKMIGEELFNKIFKKYEVDFQEEWIERERLKQEKKEKADRKNIGKIVCGVYKGNKYALDSVENIRYMPDELFKAYFKSKNGRYSNKKFQKVENIKEIFEIEEDIEKYDFNHWEDIINAYLIEYQIYHNHVKGYEKSLKRTYTKTELKCQPELKVRTDLEDIEKHIYEENIKAMEEVKKRLWKRIENLKKYSNYEDDENIKDR